MGLPSVWSRYLFFALLILVPVVFLAPALAQRASRLRDAEKKNPKGVITLSLYHRCMSVLLAYLMLLCPGVLESVVYGDTQYNQISTLDWANGNTTVEYQYDANGSCTEKETKVTTT